jgi:DNA end-binding protein Ku
MARPVWTGSISFGLVNVPVKAYTAVRDHDVHFHEVTSRGSRVRHRKVSEKSGREVETDDVKMGFEVSKGHYVTFDKEELKELRPPSTRAIEVEEFVLLEEIDPIYYEFADEILARSTIDGVPNRPSKPEAAALKMAMQLVDGLASTWDPTKYRDTYVDELRKRIKAKQAGEELAQETTPAASDGKVVDLMAALEASLQASKAKKSTGVRKTTGRKSRKSA